MDAILDMAGKTADLLWGPWTLALIAVVAVTFTLRTGFFQFIGFGTIMRNTLGVECQDIVDKKMCRHIVD